MKISYLLAPLSLATALLISQPAHAQFDMSQGGAVDVTATNGLDYDQNAMTITARGNARAVRGNVTVLADRLVAHLRKKATPPGGAPKAGAKPSNMPDTSDTGSDEIYRLEAFGHVQILTPTDHVEGADHGVYDMDQAVLVLTGPHLKLTTPQQVMTARDSMEYWSQRHMAVGRGDAVITTNDGRQISGDTLVGYTKPDDQPTAKPATAKPAPKGKTPAADPAMGGGKLQRVEAYGHVIVRTQTETVTGDRGVYLPDSGVARLLGHVHITRSQNQLEGEEGVVNTHTGASELIHPDKDAADKADAAGDQGQVSGLLMPNDAGSHADPAKDGEKPKQPDKKKGKPL